MPLSSGTKVGPYEIVAPIGSGGMGEVYKAWDARLNRMVAIKVLPDSTDSQRRARFIQEAQTASALNHPNIITVHDIIVDHSADLLVMELVSGRTLSELIVPGGMPIVEVLSLGVQIASALAVAHAARIVHRDIKPGNVMVTGSGLVKVLDFGLAKPTLMGAGDESGETWSIASPLTAQGTVVGTVNYMSPEQAEGKRVDGRSDVFSFGILLYEMVTGKTAFKGDSMIATMMAILRDEPRPIGELAPEAPKALIEIIDRCLRKSSDQRWQSMDELRAALQTLKQQYDSGAFLNAPAPPAVAPAPRGKSWIPALALTGAGVLVVSGGWWLARQQKPAPAAPPAIAQSRSEPVAPAPAPVAVPGPASGADGAGTPSGPKAVPPQPLSGAATPGTTPGDAAVPKPAATTVTVADGLPFAVELTKDVPNDADAGTPLQFRVTKDVIAEGSTIIRSGALVTGQVADQRRRKAFVIAVKMTYQLLKVDAVAGQKLDVRATPVPGQPRRPLDVGTTKKPKDVAAVAGTPYVAYIDGVQKVTVHK